MLLPNTAANRGISGATMNVCTNTMKAAPQRVGSIHRGAAVSVDGKIEPVITDALHLSGRSHDCQRIPAGDSTATPCRVRVHGSRRGWLHT
jgi:hypothetical protein